MDFVKAQFDKIQQQLAGLSASQKMLAFTLVAIMVMTMMWWARYAGNSEMSAVLDVAFPDENLSRATAMLSAKGINHSVTADKKLIVPTDRKFEVLADLGFAQLLPQNTESGFEAMITKMGPFDPKSKTDRMWNRALEMTLARVISGFPGVSNASVTIDPRRERNLDGGIHPTATVNVVTRGGGNMKTLANSAAAVVAGAVAGMQKEFVTVVVDGATAKIQGETSDMSVASNMLELKQAAERRLSQKVSEQLAFIRGVIVSVTVEVENKSVIVDKLEVDGDKNKMVHKERETVERTEESTNGTPTELSDVGVGANASATIPTGGGKIGGENKTNNSETKTSFFLETSKSTQHISNPSGKETVLAASVRVPTSYFAAIWKRSNPSATKEPDDTVLQPLINAELPKIRRDVKNCTGLKLDDDVSVETYTDVMPALDGAGAATATASSFTLPLGLQAKELAVGVLAVVSLGMMALMVRKSAPAPLPPQRVSMGNGVVMEATSPPMKSAAAANRIDTGELLAGEVGEGAQALDGMELDETLVRSRQVADQVNTMVKENPDAAVAMVKRWLQQG